MSFAGDQTVDSRETETQMFESKDIQSNNG